MTFSHLYILMLLCIVMLLTFAIRPSGPVFVSGAPMGPTLRVSQRVTDSQRHTQTFIVGQHSYGQTETIRGGSSVFKVHEGQYQDSNRELDASEIHYIHNLPTKHSSNQSTVHVAMVQTVCHDSQQKTIAAFKQQLRHTNCILKFMIWFCYIYL